jgi:DnaJ-class molecular chaperone
MTRICRECQGSGRTIAAELCAACDGRGVEDYADSAYTDDYAEAREEQELGG